MTIEKVEYRVTFASHIDTREANNLRSRIASILEQKNFGALTILFSSEGGSTDQSLALFNFISQLPTAVRMHAIGHVGKRRCAGLSGGSSQDKLSARAVLFS